jgi:hypothetical protein
MEALLGRYPGVSKTEAIERAIRSCLLDDATSRLRQLAGTLDVEDVSTTLRANDRRE